MFGKSDTLRRWLDWDIRQGDPDNGSRRVAGHDGVARQHNFPEVFAKMMRVLDWYQ